MVASGKDDKIKLLPFREGKVIITSAGTFRHRKAAIEKQRWDMILFWGGQIAPILHHKKAATLMRSLVEETSDILK